MHNYIYSYKSRGGKYIYHIGQVQTGRSHARHRPFIYLDVFENVGFSVLSWQNGAF